MVAVTRSTNSSNMTGTKDKFTNVIANLFLSADSLNLYIIPKVCIFSEKKVNKRLFFVLNVGHEEVKRLNLGHRHK